MCVSIMDDEALVRRGGAGVGGGAAGKPAR
jgi:hypothetical protein